MDEISKKLPRVKEVELEILDVVHKFCVANNLKYTLAYGTLLGAIRHKGFIPWDDDIDIWMSREDYEKFIELWNNNPIDGYILQTPYNEPEYTQNFSKVRKNNTTYLQSGEEHLTYHKGIFIDIFPLDRVASSNLKRNMQKLDAMFMMLFARKYAPQNERGLIKIISKIILSVVPKSKYDGIKFKLDKSISKKSSKYGGYKDFVTMQTISFNTFPSDLFINTMEVCFENKRFYIPKKYDEILKIIYGDYMRFPPLEERIWAHHPILIDFENNCER